MPLPQNSLGSSRKKKKIKGFRMQHETVGFFLSYDWWITILKDEKDNQVKSSSIPTLQGAGFAFGEQDVRNHVSSACGLPHTFLGFFSYHSLSFGQIKSPWVNSHPRTHLYFTVLISSSLRVTAFFPLGL